MHRPLTRPEPNLSRRQALWRMASLAGGHTLPAAALAQRANKASTGNAPRPLRLLGETTVAHRLPFQHTTIGGLSALDHDPVDNLWYALSDDRSDINPARFYTFRMTVTAQGISPPEWRSVVLLRQPDGTTYPSRKAGLQPASGPVADPEGLRFRPETRTLLWSSEGDPKLGLDPFVREVTLDGKHLREFDLPDHLKSSTAKPGFGPRDNLGFEGLAISPNGQHVWAAMEGPLQQDGPVPTVSATGGPCRFTCFDTRSGQALRQIAYVPDAIPLAPLVPGTYADNGVSEILMQSDHLMLVLERSYSLGVGNSLRLYQINVNDASDTLRQGVLTPGSFRPVPKTLIADFKHMGLSKRDNTEGLAWGPALPGHNAQDSRRTLVGVSDDNFNPAQITQLVAFEAAFEFTP